MVFFPAQKRNRKEDLLFLKYKYIVENSGGRAEKAIPIGVEGKDSFGLYVIIRSK